MTNTIEAQTINDGERNLVVKVHIDGDGSGEETATLLIDMSAYNNSPTSLRLDRVQAALTGFSVELLWDATTDVHATNIPDFDVSQDFGHIGGLNNNAGTGVTGDVNFSTVGLGSGDTGTMMLYFTKKY